MSILEARDLQFAYVSSKPVLAAINFALQPGEMAAIIGPNGCGKSTLIKIVAGILKPTAGNVCYRGASFASASSSLRNRKLAYVPQVLSRSFPFSVLEVVLTGRFPHLSRFQFESQSDIEIARDALRKVGILHLLKRPVTELSGGELQMVSVARAFAQDPDCLLLDEPSSSLDLKHRAALIRSLHELRTVKGVAVLMVTHDLSLLEPAFDTVHCLPEGEPLRTGSPADMLQPEILSGVFNDPHVRTDRVRGRTFVWSEAS